MKGPYRTDYVGIGSPTGTGTVPIGTFIDESLVIIYKAPDTGRKLIAWCQGIQSPRAAESDVVEIIIIEFMPIRTLGV